MHQAFPKPNKREKLQRRQFFVAADGESLRRCLYGTEGRAPAELDARLSCLRGQVGMARLDGLASAELGDAWIEVDIVDLPASCRRL
jgi:hypothetical protein